MIKLVQEIRSRLGESRKRALWENTVNKRGQIAVLSLKGKLKRINLIWQVTEETSGSFVKQMPALERQWLGLGVWDSGFLHFQAGWAINGPHWPAGVLDVSHALSEEGNEFKWRQWLVEVTVGYCVRMVMSVANGICITIVQSAFYKIREV